MIYKDIKWTDEKVKKFWDFESQFPEKYFTYTHGRNFLDEVDSYITNAKSVLDYGAGIGILISQLLKHDFEVTGTDFSYDSIEIVNNKFKENSNFKGAYYIDEIMTLNKKYDVIFCNEMIEHINDHYLDITFNNFKHLLSDDGVVIITTPNDEKLEDNMIFCANCDSTFHRWQHVKSWDSSSLREVISKYGFKSENIYTTFFNPIVREEKKSIPGLIADFIRKYILFRKEIKNNISTVKAPHLVAIIKK
jgi:2-polyprenyl-3-methyl-5-hydroxy-6-metoxy-1,4-benzoquinol methylase